MKSVFGDRKTIRDGFIHFFLADVIFAAFIGGSLEFIILFTLRNRALFLFHGVPGIVIEGLVTWFSVLLSAKIMQRERTIDSIGLAFIATGFSVASALIALPYIGFFSQISKVSTLYLIIKESLHASLFYTSSLLYFSDISLRSLLKDRPQGRV
jgi:hypothetical protein